MDAYDPGRGRGCPGSFDGGLVGDEARLVPILARAAELGRGPPWLVGWVRARATGLGPQASMADPSVVRRLARELARLVRVPGLIDTVPDRPAGRRAGSSLVAPSH